MTANNIEILLETFDSSPEYPPENEQIVKQAVLDIILEDSDPDRINQNLIEANQAGHAQTIKILLEGANEYLDNDIINREFNLAITRNRKDIVDIFLYSPVFEHLYIKKAYETANQNGCYEIARILAEDLGEYPASQTPAMAGTKHKQEQTDIRRTRSRNSSEDESSEDETKSIATEKKEDESSQLDYEEEEQIEKEEDQSPKQDDEDEEEQEEEKLSFK